MSSQAALEALVGKSGPLASAAFSALQSDRLIRLIRILEDSNQTATLWYLLKCESNAFNDDHLDLDFLRRVSNKLKMIRDKTFVHIDKDAVFDPQAIYNAAALTGAEIVRTLEMLWPALNRVYTQRFKETFLMGNESLAAFREVFRGNRDHCR